MSTESHQAQINFYLFFFFTVLPCRHSSGFLVARLPPQKG
jgi:hypothetical protein